MPLKLNLIVPNKAVHAFIGLVVIVALVVGVYAYTFPANFLGHGGTEVWIDTTGGETDLQTAIDSGLLGADDDWEKVGGGEPALTDDMYHTGNVGIGTTNPSTILTIGNTGTEEQVLLDNTSLKLISQTGATNTILNDDTGISYISALGGNVGIGKTNPSQKLDVAGYVKGQTGLCIGNDCRNTWPAAGTGDITGVAAGTGLTGGGSSGNVTLNADTTYLQRRVSSSCAVGSSIRVISSTGTVTCETDNTGGGSLACVSRSISKNQKCDTICGNSGEVCTGHSFSVTACHLTCAYVSCGFCRCCKIN